MWDIKPRRVMLAVESAECEAAIEYAALEARVRRCGVHVVHVVPMVFGGNGSIDTLVMVNGELHARGRDVLGEVATSLEHRLSDTDVAITTELCHGTVVPTLVNESAHASLVVLQHRRMRPADDTALMSHAGGVAARARCPVVVVPSEWREPSSDLEWVVTVGIGGDRDNAYLLAQGAGAAASHCGSLRVVHAGENLELRDLVESPPEVPFTYVPSTASPVDALLAQGGRTSLFVVGRRHPGLPIARHLGPVARTLLRRSPMPVMVVDPQRDDEAESGHDLATAAIP